MYEFQLDKRRLSCGVITLGFPRKEFSVASVATNHTLVSRGRIFSISPAASSLPMSLRIFAITKSEKERLPEVSHQLRMVSVGEPGRHSNHLMCLCSNPSLSANTRQSMWCGGSSNRISSLLVSWEMKNADCRVSMPEEYPDEQDKCL